MVFSSYGNKLVITWLVYNVYRRTTALFLLYFLKWYNLPRTNCIQDQNLKMKCCRSELCDRAQYAIESSLRQFLFNETFFSAPRVSETLPKRIPGNNTNFFESFLENWIALCLYFPLCLYLNVL